MKNYLTGYTDRYWNVMYTRHAKGVAFVIAAAHDKLANMNNRYTIAGVLVLVLLGGAAWWYTSRTVSDSSKSTEDTFSLAAGDTITSWDFKGLYTGNTALEEKAHKDIERLNGMFGTEGNTDYILYVSIAAQHEFLGDGGKEYEYLLRALKEDSTTTGLAWYNLGTLLVRLGAFNSARVAYANAAKAQPGVDQYPTKYFEFLTQQFPKDTQAIEKAFVDANAAAPTPSTILQIYARWLEGEGRIQEAITNWQKIKEVSPSSAAAVEIELRRLRSKL